MEVPIEHFDEERIAFLALSAIKGVGFETLRRISLLNQSFTNILDLEDSKEVRNLLGRSELQEGDGSQIAWRETRARALESAKRRVEELALAKISIIFQSDKDFPVRLRDLHNTPRWLFVQGDTKVLSRRSIAVVGSRESTQDGSWLTQYVGHWLSEFGVPTVSGLADGIDQIIHCASIKAGVPTIAFLGTGIFMDYPRGSEKVRQAILMEGGAVATEYLIKDGYSAASFVRRNRLQAALGRILIPTEWNLKSGTAHTVRFAHELSRPIVFMRTPSQPKLDWVPREYLGGNGFFTVPVEQDQFLSFVFKSLRTDFNASEKQLKLL